MTAFSPPSKKRRSDTRLAFVIGLNLCLAGIYTNFAVHVGGYWVPGVLVIAGTFFLVPQFLARDTRNLFWLGWLFLFLTFSLVAGGSGAEMFDYRLTSWLQIVAALGCAHIIFCTMQFPEVVRKTLFVWMVFIVVGIILESTFPAIRGLSDSFRQTIFEGRFVYASDVRDLRLYGFVRPKLFTQEPSHVAKAFVIIAVGWYLLASRKRTIYLLAFTAVAVLFLGSPFVLLALPLAWFLDRMASGRPITGMVALALPVLGILSIVLAQVFSTRLASILGGGDSSFIIRFQAPYEVALRSIEQYPIFGVGIGAKEALSDQIANVYLPFFDSSWLYENYSSVLGNAFANSFIYFGLAGAALFYYLVTKWASGFAVKSLVTMPVILLLFQLDGAIESVRMWGYIALVLGSYALAKKSRDNPKNADFVCTSSIQR